MRNLFAVANFVVITVCDVYSIHLCDASHVIVLLR